jgi:hypothetical protein
VKHLTEEIVYFYINDKHDYQTALQYQLRKYEYMMKMAEMSKLGDVNDQKHAIADSRVELADIYSLLYWIYLASEKLTVTMNLYDEIEDDMAEQFHKEEKLTLISEKKNKLTDISSSDQYNSKRFTKESD